MRQFHEELLVNGAFSRRTHASAISDYMVSNAKTKLLALPNVGHLLFGQRHLFTLGNDFVLHLKKLDGMRRSMGILTQQRLEFLEQRHPQLQLPFGGERTFIEAGYSWHEEFRIAWGVYVACPLKNPADERVSNLWVIQLRGESDAQAEPISISPIIPSGKDADAIIVPRLADTYRHNQEATDGQ